MNNLKTAFMAIAIGKEQKTDNTFKLYEGLCDVEILAINPNKDKLSKLIGRDIEKEPTYLTKAEDKDGNLVDNLRICFVVKARNYEVGNVVPEGVQMLNFFVRKSQRTNTDKTKVQVIDKYGRTAWVTNEEAANHIIPMYSNGPAKLDVDYRPIYQGEEELTSFIKTFVNIPNVDVYNRTNGSWTTHNDPSSCECRLDNIAKYFNGDLNELQAIVTAYEKNAVKTMWYVQDTDKGQFQQILNRVFMSPSVQIKDSHVNFFNKKINEIQNNGGLSGITFKYEAIKEYSTAQPTNIEEDVFNNTSNATAGINWLG